MAPKVPEEDKTSMAGSSLVKPKTSKPQGTHNKSSKTQKVMPSKKLSQEKRDDFKMTRRDRSRLGNLKKLPLEIRERIYVNVYGRQTLYDSNGASGVSRLYTKNPTNKMVFATEAIKNESIRAMYAEGLISLVRPTDLEDYLDPQRQYITRHKLGESPFTSNMARKFILHASGGFQWWIDVLGCMDKARLERIRVMVFHFRHRSLDDPDVAMAACAWVESVVRIISNASNKRTAFFLRDRDDRDPVRVTIEFLLRTAGDEDNYPIA